MNQLHFSKKTIFEVCAGVLTNLTAGWFGVVLISPSFIGIKYFQGYISLLFPNILFGILGLLGAFWFTEKINNL